MTTARPANQMLKALLDRSFAADCTGDAEPVFDHDGMLVGAAPDTTERAP